MSQLSKASNGSGPVARGTTSQGSEVQGSLVRLSRHQVVFELLNLQAFVQLSERLKDFQILIADNAIYRGEAVVSSVVNLGSTVVCEASLEDTSFDLGHFLARGDKNYQAQFRDFMERWQTIGKVRPEFKLIVAEIQVFLVDLRCWLEQVEVRIGCLPAEEPAAAEREALDGLCRPVFETLDALFDRFEASAHGLEPELQAAHRSYVQRQLHPLVMCAPFANRVYHKPLGYAGDYEMVNMMLGDPWEGSSLYAKLFNALQLRQQPVQAHRNRITLLTDLLAAEASRTARAGRVLRVFNLGCGPAVEVQQFISQSQLSNEAEFVLVDFNDQTLAYARQALESRIGAHGRRTAVHWRRKSVQQLLKEALRTGQLAGEKPFDLVYCAGLLDYLPDHVSKLLLDLFYRSVAPGGLVLVTNVGHTSPNRGSMELILDWHLTYRDARQMKSLAPPEAEAVTLRSDPTGLNLFLELRKPHGS